jgi:dienelactone hydrolase
MVSFNEQTKTIVEICTKAARVLASTPARSRLKCFHRYYPSNFAQSPIGTLPKPNPILLQWNVEDSVTSQIKKADDQKAEH